jgi:transcriptional regulator with XRE-family HTH domain
MVDLDKFKVLLALAGRDQRDLASAVGVSPATMSRALRGQRPLGAAMRRRIAETLVDAVLASGAA